MDELKTLKDKIIALESQVEYFDQELVAHQYVLAWLLKTHPHPEAKRFLARLANDLEKHPQNKMIVEALDALREIYASVDAFRDGNQ